MIISHMRFCSFCTVDLIQICFTNRYLYSLRIPLASAEGVDACRDKDPHLQPASSPLLSQKRIIPTELPPLVTVGHNRRGVFNRPDVGEIHLFEGNRYRFYIPLIGM